MSDVERVTGSEQVDDVRSIVKLSRVKGGERTWVINVRDDATPEQIERAMEMAEQADARWETMFAEVNSPRPQRGDVRRYG